MNFRSQQAPGDKQPEKIATPSVCGTIMCMFVRFSEWHSPRPEAYIFFSHRFGGSARMAPASGFGSRKSCFTGYGDVSTCLPCGTYKSYVRLWKQAGTYWLWSAAEVVVVVVVVIGVVLWSWVLRLIRIHVNTAWGTEEEDYLLLDARYGIGFDWLKCYYWCRLQKGKLGKSTVNVR